MNEDNRLNTLLFLNKKERLLSEIIVWLKAKNLWEQCKRDVNLVIKENHSSQEEKWNVYERFSNNPLIKENQYEKLDVNNRIIDNHCNCGRECECNK